jgi:hypothetical protein
MSDRYKEGYLAGLKDALEVKISLPSYISNPAQYEIFDAGREAKAIAIQSLIEKVQP